MLFLKRLNTVTRATIEKIIVLINQKKRTVNIDVFSNPEKYLVTLPADKIVASPKVSPEGVELYKKKIESGEEIVVGVNSFTGEHELEVNTSRLVPQPYDPEKREEAESKQVAKLREVKKNRDNRNVARLLKDLKQAAQKPEENLIPYMIECVKEYTTLQEICDVYREAFGEYRDPGLY